MFNLRNFFNVLEYKEIDSSNTESIRLIQNDIINQKTIIFSEKQTFGRGKKDAIWESPKGNIHLSLIYPILFDEVEKYNNFQDFSLFIGLSLYEVINFYKNSKCEVVIKKPNDILINGKKVAGILVESVVHKDFYYLIIGIGINWNIAPIDTSDYIKKFLDIEKDKFIFHLMMDIKEKINNFQFYYHQILTI